MLLRKHVGSKTNLAAAEGKSSMRLLAALVMMFLAAACFVCWPIVIVQSVLVGSALHTSVVGLPVFLAGIIGGTCLCWGGAQALIAYAAHQLGAGIQASPSERWNLPQGYRGRWVLSVLGTIVFILVIDAWWLSLS